VGSRTPGSNASRAASARALAALGLALLSACSSRTDPLPPAYTVICVPGELECDGDVSGVCDVSGSALEDTVVCEGHTPLCAPGLGCVACMPGSRRCQGSSVLACDGAGARWTLAETCEGESVCYEGSCGSDCARAAVYRSYEGCEYVAATLMNSQLPPDFQPALVFGNRNADPATVTVTRGRTFSELVTVPPDSTATLMLPWNTELRDAGLRGGSVSSPDGAFRVESSLPVTVYQFNPLEYALDHDCSRNDPDPSDGRCFSYTNDASLLLPVTVLTEHYIVMSRPNLGFRFAAEGEADAVFSFLPSVLAVVNPHETDVDVEVLASAPIASGPGVSALEAGETRTFTLRPGGVLQLAARSPTSCEPDWSEPEPIPCGGGRMCEFGYCALTDLDLTGTEIVAEAPVAVFGAHDCDFIPFNRWACDHLEEQIFPFETWGRDFVVNQTHRENGEPDLWRVLSGADGNTIRFDPDDVHEAVTLARGEHIELEAHGAFEVHADGPILVGQFLVGQNYNFVPAEQELPPGDPAFALAVPVEQWRDAYNFLAPGSYDRSFINLISTKDCFQAVLLDGVSLGGEDWQRLGDYVTLRLEIPPGSHRVHAADDQPFSILVYGFGQYTSYMVPGGLKLDPISMW
jgi:hypothetical protein